MLIFSFPASGGLVITDFAPIRQSSEPVVQAAVAPVPTAALSSLELLFERNKVETTYRTRAAEAILRSSQKHNIDPRLVASIMIVESGADPFAISPADSIGIMQVHLPTWGPTADKEGINLFNIEDNVDFGVRILKSYVRKYGVWDGVKRYRGWIGAASEHNAYQYVQKVQRIYGYQPPVEITETLQ